MDDFTASARQVRESPGVGLGERRRCGRARHRAAFPAAQQRGLKQEPRRGARHRARRGAPQVALDVLCAQHDGDAALARRGEHRQGVKLLGVRDVERSLGDETLDGLE